ncbi:helix-turn-helix domain-containing protein [Halosimplex halobium]|uniref:helix-turn-helix domain-containing protein n=1 Tax=Halosimplex halobium TaxID=3396618 RepID=UPI003F5517F5
MSYDTEHVRTGGDSPDTITGIPTFTDLLSNTDLASLYSTIRNSGAATGPELVETVTVSKKTVYEYLRKLEHAGLLTEVESHTGPTEYEAADFELSLTVRDVEVSITPEIVAVIARSDDFPVIDRVLDDHGIVTFALAFDLATAHRDGEITTRQLASLTGLSSGTAYDLLEALYEIREFESDTPPTTYSPADFDDEAGELQAELTDE